MSNLNVPQKLFTSMQLGGKLSVCILLLLPVLVVIMMALAQQDKLQVSVSGQVTQLFHVAKKRYFQ